MAFDFPASPTPGQEFNPAGGPTYVWQPPRWVLKGVGVAWGGITGTLSAQTDLQTALNAKASLAGAAFTGDITVPDEAYGVAWNSSVEAPTKNALYDKIQSLPVVPVLTTGGITFGSATGTLGQDTANLFFDDTSNQLMVGGAVTSPSFNLASSAAYFSGTAVYTTVNFDNFDFMQYAKGTDTLVFNVAAAERLRITSAGFVGVGTGNPTAQLTVAAQGTIHATRYGASQPSITFMTAGGTEAAPTPPGIGQGCGAFVWRAYDGVSNYAQLGGVNGFAEAAPTATSSPGFITLATTATGAVSSTERMRITSAGRVGIGYVPGTSDATLETGSAGAGGGMIRANIGGAGGDPFNPGLIIRNLSQANNTAKNAHLLAQGRTVAGAEVDQVGTLTWEPLDVNWDNTACSINIRAGLGSFRGLTVNVNGCGVYGAYQYSGLTLNNSYGSAAQFAASYIDFRNELNTPTAYVFGNMFTDGSSNITIAATAAGARNTDRRVPVLSIASNAVSPAVDNAYPLGWTGGRWTTVYVTTAPIVGSDERIKTWRGGLTPEEIAAGTEIADTIGLYQLNDAIAEKGDSARFHSGIVAQTVGAILTSHGLTPEKYGFFCYDEWEERRVPNGEGREDQVTPAGNRYSIRYEELAMFLVAAQHARMNAIEARLAAIGA